jgi:hypothetical protein
MPLRPPPASSFLQPARLAPTADLWLPFTARTCRRNVRRHLLAPLNPVDAMVAAPKEALCWPWGTTSSGPTCATAEAPCGPLLASLLYPRPLWGARMVSSYGSLFLASPPSIGSAHQIFWGFLAKAVLQSTAWQGFRFWWWRELFYGAQYYWVVVCMFSTIGKIVIST